MKPNTEPCKTCGGLIGRTARKCPHCGTAYTRLVDVLVVLALAAGIAFMFSRCFYPSMP